MAEGEMSPPVDTSCEQHPPLTLSFQTSFNDDAAEASTSNKLVFASNNTSATLPEAPTATYNVSDAIPLGYNTDNSENLFSKDLKDSLAIPGSCGLYNLGNTCFMNAGLQSLLASDQLVKYCLEELALDPDQNQTLLGRFRELVTKTWNGGYSVIYPRDFKETLSLYHNQFQDYRQHDCQEFLALLLDSLHEQILLTTRLQPDQSQISDQTKQTDLSQSQEPTGESSTSSSSLLNNNSSHWTSSDTSQAEAMETGQSNTGSHEWGEQRDLFLEPSQSSRVEGKGAEQGDMKLSNSKQSVIMDKAGDSDSTGSSVTISNVSLFGSEDSNQSTVSLHSSDSEHANNFKTLNIKTSPEGAAASACPGADEDEVAMATRERGVESTSMDDTESKADLPTVAQTTPSTVTVATGQFNNSEADANNHSSPLSPTKANEMPKLNNTRITSLASLEEFYSKDCKTLNTNMLFDEVLNNVNVDSDKFSKMDNRVRTEQQVNILEEVMSDEEKSEKAESSFGLKDTNLRADKKSRSISCSKTFPVNEEEEVYSLNNVKRIKTEQNEAEKNFQMEEMLKYRKNKSNIRDDLSRRSLTPDSLMEAEVESSDEEGEVTSRSSTVDDIPSVLPPLEGFSETDEKEADRAWADYLAENDSVVVKSFQGQFKSTIICSECSHISVTFEPFMYLSLPIPRAMERQMCLTVIGNDAQPTRYLLNMFKTDNVAKLRKEVKSLIEKPDSDIILAEVFDNHISRLLDDNVMLRYVNDSTRKIYAFEMSPPPILPDSNSQSVVETAASILVADDNPPPLPPKKSNSGDIFSQMGTFSAGMPVNSSNKDTQGEEAGTAEQSETDKSLNNHQPNFVSLSSAATEESSNFMSNVDTAGTGMWEWTQYDQRVNPLPGPSWDSHVYDNPIGPAPRSSPVNFNPTFTSGGHEGSTTMCGIADQWKSCAICLEELADSELLVHTSCDGTFCDSCLEMSMKHSSDNGHCCPICQSPASRTEDFVPLSSSVGHKPAARILAIPVCFRFLKDEKPVLFSHPNIVYLPSHVSGQTLYSTVNTVVSPGLVYSVVLTDGQGKHCSRCQYMDHCSGCVMSREGEVTLQPGDHLAVQVEDLTPMQVVDAESVVDHISMGDRRPDEPANIYDCFTAFTQCEVLDEQNPWFCPQCRKNQCAIKRMTVWRYPDTLIVHLKRFVFHEFSSTKIDNPVIFPEKNLELSEFLSGPKHNDLQYDLYSIVCHFGGSNSGHYTSYTRHPVSGNWFYYNDETVTRATPKQDEYSSGYVLFYQKHGSQVAMVPPVKESVCETILNTTNTVEIPDDLDSRNLDFYS